MKMFYRRRLPHLVPPGGCFFVTFRLHGTLPYTIIRQLQSERDLLIRKVRTPRSLEGKKELTRIHWHHFVKCDSWLDKALKGPRYLANKEVAKIVADKLHEFDGELYDLMAFSILSNHVHVILDTYLQLEKLNPDETLNKKNFVRLDKVMQRIKGGSSKAANQLLGRSGQFWKSESYDHWIRNERSYWNIVRYVVENPVKAKLVRDWRDWPFTYVKKEVEEKMLG